MARWAGVAQEAPELAARAKAFFDAHDHKVLATVRRDGRPRISATECLFADGDLWLGSMWLSNKALDLRRDHRFALHCGTVPQAEWKGDAKVGGTVEEVTDPEEIRRIITMPLPPEGAHLFRADVRELAVITVDMQRRKMVVESWHEGVGVRVRER